MPTASGGADEKTTALWGSLRPKGPCCRTGRKGFPAPTAVIPSAGIATPSYPGRSHSLQRDAIRLTRRCQDETEASMTEERAEAVGKSRLHSESSTGSHQPGQPPRKSKQTASALALSPSIQSFSPLALRRRDFFFILRITESTARTLRGCILWIEIKSATRK